MKHMARTLRTVSGSAKDMKAGTKNDATQKWRDHEHPERKDLEQILITLGRFEELQNKVIQDFFSKKTFDR